MINATSPPEAFMERVAETGDRFEIVYGISSVDTSNGEIVVCDPTSFNLSGNVHDIGVDRLWRRRTARTMAHMPGSALDIECGSAGIGVVASRRSNGMTFRDPTSAARQFAFDLFSDVKVLMKRAVDAKCHYAGESSRDVCAVLGVCRVRPSRKPSDKGTSHDGENGIWVAAGAMAQRMTAYWIREVRGKRPAAYPGYEERFGQE